MYTECYPVTKSPSLLIVCFSLCSPWKTAEYFRQPCPVGRSICTIKIQASGGTVFTCQSTSKVQKFESQTFPQAESKCSHSRHNNDTIHPSSFFYNIHRNGHGSTWSALPNNTSAIKAQIILYFYITDVTLFT